MSRTQGSAIFFLGSSMGSIKSCPVGSTMFPHESKRISCLSDRQRRQNRWRLSGLKSHDTGAPFQTWTGRSRRKARYMYVSPLASKGRQGFLHQKRADGISPWLRDRLSCLSLLANGTAFNVNKVGLEIIERSFFRIILLSLAMALPFAGHHMAQAMTACPRCPKVQT